MMKEIILMKLEQKNAAKLVEYLYIISKLILQCLETPIYRIEE